MKSTNFSSSVTCFLALLLLAGPVFAQADSREQTADDHPTDITPARHQDEEELRIPISSDPGKQPWVRQFGQDEWKMWTSPFRKGSYSTSAFTKYVVPFTIVTGVLIATDHRTANLLPNTTDQSKWSLRVSQIGAPYTLAGMAATMYIASRITGDKKARETGFLGAIAIAHSQLLVLGLKTATQRERPSDFRQNNSGGIAFGKGGDSFPSGHAAGSFALATIFSYEYGREHKWVPYTAYGLSSLVAASRISGERHWLSDVFVGSTMGFLVGRFIYREHHDSRIDGHVIRRAELRNKWVPQIGFGGTTLALNWNLADQPR